MPPNSTGGCPPPTPSVIHCPGKRGAFRRTSDTVFDTFPWPQFAFGVPPSGGPASGKARASRSSAPSRLKAGHRTPTRFPTHEPERRAPARLVETQQVRAERELGAPTAVQGRKSRLFAGRGISPAL